MLFRNLMAMATEEMIAAQPMDAVVLLGGCDKTLPAQLMASASASVPAIHLVAGPMLAGDWRGERLGACTDCRRYWAQHRAGALDAEEIAAVEQSLCPTAGTCMVMGTASTMACVTEALGLMLPGAATPPAVSGQRLRLGVATGRRAVALATEGRPARDILTPAAFANALKVLAALSGSTNAVVHLLAIARRAGVDLSLDDFHTAAQQVPLLVDCKPAGTGYMEDFDKAGGVPVLLKALEPMLDLDTIGVNGQPLGALLQDVAAPGAWQTAIRTLDAPLGPASSLVVLKGSLAPDGAVLKRPPRPRTCTNTEGQPSYSRDPDDAARVDDPALGITPEHVLVLRGAGPVPLECPKPGPCPCPNTSPPKASKTWYASPMGG